MNAYFEDGYHAYKQGKELADNPYIGRDIAFAEREWRRGWRAAEAESFQEEAVHS